MPVTNGSGEVAVIYRNNVPRLVDGKHVFSVQHGVSLAWVPEATAADLVRRRSTCRGCGNKKLFAFATPEQVYYWQHGRVQGRESCCG